MQSQFSKQISLKEVGIDGQKKIQAARVLIVGVGGLGCPALTYLAAMGVGTIGIVDHDKVDSSNLSRQYLYSYADIGKLKVEVASERISFNSHDSLKVQAYDFAIDENTASNLVDHYDYILDCTDNFDAKFLLHDICFLKGKDLVTASIHQYDGELKVFRFSEPQSNQPCLRCLYPKKLRASCAGSCQESGVLAATAGIFGTMQSLEIIKCILDTSSLPNLAAGVSMHYNSLSHEIYKSQWPKNLSCPLCSKPKDLDIKKLDLAEDSISLNLKSIEELETYQIIDLRTSSEIENDPFVWGSSKLFKDFETESVANYKTLFVCQKGTRSERLVLDYRSRGLENTFSLKGGVDACKF